MSKAGSGDREADDSACEGEGWDHVTVRSRGRLPHWEMEGGVYFVTFRLADSLPQSILAEWRRSREAALARARDGGALTPRERQRIAALFRERVQAHLDAGVGACHLAKPGVAELCAEALRHFDGSRYRLFGWCVMPNHVHVVLRLLGGHRLSDTLHSWKSYTGTEANRLLGRRGALWAREYHDHLVRDEREFFRILRYVADNPARAGLRDWRWVWVCDDYRDVDPELCT